MRVRARRVEVRTEEEIVDAVRAARDRGARVRAVGSGGSKSRISSTRAVVLHLNQPDRLLEVRDGLVTVPAGMTTGRLQSLLRPEGLALPTVGEWKNATIAGALCTGTHGGSARHGIMSTSVRGLRVVTGTGEVVEISADDPDFDHVGVSLGAFGIITTVTLECVERFSLELKTDVVPFDETMRDPVAQESRSEFHASVWVPSARRVIRFAADRTPDPVRSVPRRERFGRRTALAWLLSRRLGFHGAVVSRMFGGRALGDWDEILSPLAVSSRVARFRNVANAVRRRTATEFAVAASRAPEALARFDEFFREHSRALNNPIGLRMNASDRFSVSPCSGRDTLWLDLFYDDTGSFVTELVALARDLGARSHWGKALALPPEFLQRHYPSWNAFREARARFDPDEVFANAFTDEFGLTGASSGGGCRSGASSQRGAG